MRWSSHSLSQIGVDEVNFSPSIAGDCVAAACLLLDRPSGKFIKDSKATTREGRIQAFEWLQRHSLYVVEVGSVNHINKFGIYRARNAAMNRAIFGLLDLAPGEWTDYTVIVDGRPIPELVTKLGKVAVDFIVDGDATVPAVAAASIIAKLHVDALFEGWALNWPGYGMNQDHGSLSKEHRRKLRLDGPSPVHRTDNYAPGWWRRILYSGRPSKR